MNKILFTLFSIIALLYTGTFISCEDDEEIVEENYLYLYGEECSKIDTTADPDTLMPLPDSICGDTVVVDTSGSTGDAWEISMGELAPFMESILDSEVIANFPSIEFKLERQSPVGGNTVVGTWEVEVDRFPPYIPKDLLINIAFKDADSTFLLGIIEKDEAKHIYTHNGSWEIKEEGNGSYIVY